MHADVICTSHQPLLRTAGGRPVCWPAGAQDGGGEAETVKSDKAT